MVTTLLTATIPNNDGLAKDEVRFSWVLADSHLSDTDAQTVFSDFFRNAHGGADAANQEALASCLNAGTTVGAVGLRAYDISATLGGGPHGSPYMITSTKLDTTGGDSRGNQLCVVIGYQSAAYLATPVDGPMGEIPTPESAQDMGAPPTHEGVTKLQSRQSGRMYFGPVDGSIIGVDGNANPEITDTWKNDFALNVGGFLSLHPEWSIWSRRNAAISAVTQGWIDFSLMTRRHKAFAGAGRGTWT